ncbi:DUF3846 domain-containing protein [Subtercola vilae]|uniref:DUF3846 domain-containing protein n=1 Tax=Subtercola vilae TaxID=2056433 RepID=A0A4V4RF07_9MICO|nr:DUF3846 domain-containing protein [Subtercola vilae]TIH36134.1 DUF3846 domain-containing protein [Subtercola vilae]
MLYGIRLSLDGDLARIEIDDSTVTARLSGITQSISVDVFDAVGLPEGIDVFVDDEGLYRSSLNIELSVIARSNGIDGVLFGAGLFLGHASDGESVSLTDEQINIIIGWRMQYRPAAEYTALLAPALLGNI